MPAEIGEMRTCCANFLESVSDDLGGQRCSGAARWPGSAHFVIRILTAGHSPGASINAPGDAGGTRFQSSNAPTALATAHEPFIVRS